MEKVPCPWCGENLVIPPGYVMEPGDRVLCGACSAWSTVDPAGSLSETLNNPFIMLEKIVWDVKALLIRHSDK